MEKIIISLLFSGQKKKKKVLMYHFDEAKKSIFQH